jgi:methylmalonyl-CoA mutase N-terminal domain/subunit
MEFDYSDMYPVNPEKSGGFPFTRGIHSEMYLKKPWTIRQYSGFGSAKETNAIFREQIRRGANGISIAFDLPTQLGLDSDDPKSLYDVCKVGVAIDSIDDMRQLLENIDLEKISISMTINATALFTIIMYKIVAEERGFKLPNLHGTIQNDILKEFIARSTHIFKPEFSMKLAMYTIKYIQENLPAWNPISVSGYHMAEAGANSTEEVGFAICNALEYIRFAKRNGIDVERFIERMSFFFSARTSLLEEVAKFRAARRVWAKLIAEDYSSSEKVQKMRFHTQTAGVELERHDVELNIVRVTIQALAAVLGGSQSIHTNSFDEAISIPGQYSASIARETQKIILSETDLCSAVDPLGGSFVIENLTNQMEAGIKDCIEKVERAGGALQAIQSEYQKKVIETNAYAIAMKRELELRASLDPSNKSVSYLTSFSSSSVRGYEHSGKLIDNLKVFKNSRCSPVPDLLSKVQNSLDDYKSLVESIEIAFKNGVTIGEIVSCIKISKH